MAHAMFTVVPAVDLQAERDVFVGLPQENTNKQTFHRIPIRSSTTESAGGDRRIQVKMVPGQSNVVQSTQGLRRFMIKFPQVFVPGIKVFEANGENDRTNMSMGFALYDSRNGPTPEESRILQNLDGLAMFLRQTMVRCDRIRRVLKLGDSMTVQQQQVAAEMMDLHVARPLPERQEGNPGYRANNGQQTDDRPPPARFCYVKLVAPDPAINERFHTYFWTTDGRRLPFETVLGFRNFQVQPYVEVEDIFVSKAVRSLQLKLRECLVVPPAERPQQRFSVCFPDRVCAVVEENAEDTEKRGRAPEAEVIPEPKRARVEEAEVVAEAAAEEDDEEDKASQATEKYVPDDA